MRKMKFTDIVTIVGKIPDKFVGEKHYVSTGALAVNKIISESVELVTYEDRPSRANLIADTDDILFAKMALTEKTLLLDEDNSQNIYSTGFCAVRANKNIISSKCLFYLLSSCRFLEQKNKYASGATQKAITNVGLERIIVNIPSMTEQDSLVRKMDYLSNIIELCNEQIKKMDLLVKSRFIEIYLA